MTAAEITLGAVMCALWAVFLILSAMLSHWAATQQQSGGTASALLRASPSVYMVRPLLISRRQQAERAIYRCKKDAIYFEIEPCYNFYNAING